MTGWPPLGGLALKIRPKRSRFLQSLSGAGADARWDSWMARPLQLRHGMEEPGMWRLEDAGPDVDSDILEELCARLAADSEVEAGRLEVDVRDREVILEGTTRDERMTRAVMMCVIQVPGVRAVRSYLQTSPI